MAESVCAHVDLFQRLRSSLRRDLTVSAGIPNPVAGSILNWFDPAKPEYLAHVDAWQKLLCQQCAAEYPPFFGDSFDRWSAIQIAAIHQVAKLVYKWHGKPAKETDWSAVAERLSSPLPHRLKDDEITGIRKCLSGILPVDLTTAVGRFGPGATSEGFDSADKWRRRGLCPDVPPSLYRCSPRDTWSPEGRNVFRCTRMAEVPKSIKCNRVVSSEPAMSMFAQLAVNDHLDGELHRLFHGHVSLHDQDRHNRLLRLPMMATLDLSDASDHIRCNLVESVLPQLWPILATVRSEYTIVPTIGCIRLTTHAPMGAGICFSVMTAVIIGIIAYAFSSLHFNWKKEPWSVYGDDIIVPIWICDYIIDLLERAGTVINHAKSCYTGKYVESCGLELYHGYDITPVYLKDDITTLECSKVEAIAHKWCDLFPSTLKDIIDLATPVKGSRWNEDIQEQELLVRTRSARSHHIRIDGYDGLNRWFCTRTLEDVRVASNGKTFVEPTGVEVKVRTKLTWRYRSVINYPTLSRWLAANGSLR